MLIVRSAAGAGGGLPGAAVAARTAGDFNVLYPLPSVCLCGGAVGGLVDLAAAGEKKNVTEVVLHMQLKFPETYPRDPPTLTLFTPLSHPNVFAKRQPDGQVSYRVCLDMLETASASNAYSGWSSSYTVASMLAQLQCTRRQRQGQAAWAWRGARWGAGFGEFSSSLATRA